ncbi:MAG: DUF3015 family protein [Silvanigrellaceae bacterium]
MVLIVGLSGSATALALAVVGGSSVLATYGTRKLLKSDNGKESARLEMDNYISTNLSALEKEVSQGEGEHLVAFAEMIACDKEPGIGRFNVLSKQFHSVIFSDRHSKGIVERWLQKARNDVVTSECFRG